jgi:hypothetical protein
MKKEVMKEVAQLSQFDEELYRVSECAEPSITTVCSQTPVVFDAAMPRLFLFFNLDCYERLCKLKCTRFFLHRSGKLSIWNLPYQRNIALVKAVVDYFL